MPEHELSEELKRALKECIDHYDKEDRSVREKQLRQWKKLKYFWSGFSRLWYSEVAHDWRVFDRELSNDSSITGDASYYDKPLNVFRAYLESIIAALSTTVPSIKCFPDDADNALDLSTAKAGDRIANLIYRHNDVPLLWVHALYVLCTEGMIACYSYPKEDKSFGLVTQPKYDNVEEEITKQYCPNCGNELNQENEMMNENQDLGMKSFEMNELDEYQPDNEDVELHNRILSGKKFCLECSELIDPELRKEKIVVEKMVGIYTKPKARQCLEVYGGLNVKIPNYARNQEEIPYLIYNYETHYALAIQEYPHLKDAGFSDSRSIISSGGIYDPYERWARLSTQYFGEYPLNTVTIRKCWLRNSAFNVCGDEELTKRLKKRFPDGCKVVYINDHYCESENESLDDCWTITKNPLSDYIHYDALGMLLTSIQEITNDITSLVLQTMEHGIPQTFADPEVLNFEQYRQVEAAPGIIFPAKPKSGKNLGESFYEVKTATLSQEVQPFAEKIQQIGQFISGALPSLFGGANPGASRTASEYSMSRAQALQRLQTTWKMLNFWWKSIFGKVIPAYIKTMLDDERFVTEDKNGNFINVFIRRAELQGKLGQIELEASEQLPLTWAQQNDKLMQLMQSQNPEIIQALTNPENLPSLINAIGLDNFSIPGEDDREKQYEEINLLVNSTPLDDNTPSIPVEPLVDNHGIEGDICRGWLISPAGRLAKTEKPDGYRNVLLHLQQHILAHTQAIQGMQQLGPNPEPQPIMQGQNNANAGTTIQ